jgi:hypothetical protein
MKPPSEKTLKLIYEYEVGGGENYYNRFLKKFTWPGLQSGPTIGIGIDCAYYTAEELGSIFSFLSASELALVKKCPGKKGAAGKEYTTVLREAGIEMSWKEAQKVFLNTTWSKFARLTDQVFPGASNLCDDAYGALVSLVFNRGASLNGGSRLEMRKIKDLVPVKNYAGIATQIRSMKRLWEGKNAQGLLKRRDAEASLVLGCLQKKC